MRCRLRPVAVLAVLWLIPELARGQEKIPAAPSVDRLLKELSGLHAFREAVISPDGGRVAWVESRAAAGKGSAVWVAELPANEAGPRRVTAGGREGADEHGVAWAPDGRRLAFLSDADRAGQFQLYVAEPGGGEVQRLTELTGFLAEPRWSPDGKEIAFLFTANAPRTPGPTQAGTRDVGVIEDEVHEQRLALVEVASRQVRLLSPADTYIYE